LRGTVPLKSLGRDILHVRSVAFTVDVDRDVNLACHGEICSISNTRNGDRSPRFTSSAQGLQMILELLRESGVRGTFFWEGRTADEISDGLDLAKIMEGHETAVHGYDHEDFTGKETGIPLDEGQVREVLDRAETALDRTFGRNRRGFRAPYQRTSAPLMAELCRRRYLYDSSDTAPMVSGKVSPYRRPDGLLEAPVCWSLDRKGRKIVSYLWPYHEGNRPMTDYLEMMDQLDEGLLVIATHSWHLVESFSGGLLSKDVVQRGTEDLLSLLRHGQETGVEFVTLADHLRRKNDL